MALDPFLTRPPTENCFMVANFRKVFEAKPDSFPNFRAIYLGAVPETPSFIFAHHVIFTKLPRKLQAVPSLALAQMISSGDRGDWCKYHDWERKNYRQINLQEAANDPALFIEWCLGRFSAKVDNGNDYTYADDSRIVLKPRL